MCVGTVLFRLPSLAEPLSSGQWPTQNTMKTNRTHTTKEVIGSRNHPSIKRIRNLHLRAERDRTGLFCIEGVRFVAQAIEHGVPIETLLFAPSLLTNPFGQRLVRQQQRMGTPCLEVTPE